MQGLIDYIVSIFCETIYKYWRDDKRLWEEKIKILGLISCYKYSIWKDGLLITFFQRKPFPNPKYSKSATITNVYIGQKYIDEHFNGNKWTVPVNYLIDYSIDDNKRHLK